MAIVNDSYDAGYARGYDHANYASAYGEAIQNPNVLVPEWYDRADFLAGYAEGVADYMNAETDSIFEMDCA